MKLVLPALPPKAYSARTSRKSAGTMSGRCGGQARAARTVTASARGRALDRLDGTRKDTDDPSHMKFLQIRHLVFIGMCWLVTKKIIHGSNTV
ncbi:MAG: hypothetical protein KKC71_01720 [Chloroflexi bacterium]|nr:hypothetical protein [Chloroflexota bacterium]